MSVKVLTDFCVPGQIPDGVTALYTSSPRRRKRVIGYR